MTLDQIKATTPDEWAQRAASLRAESARREREKQESFERCDTDGFLSQYSLGLSAERDRMQATICDNHGKSSFCGLYQGDRRVKARQIMTKFGSCWLLHEDEKDLIAKRGKPFLPNDLRGNSKIHRQLGVKERPEWDWAWAKFEGRGRGLSGTVWVEVYRVGDKWGADAELDEDHDINEIARMRTEVRVEQPDDPYEFDSIHGRGKNT